MLFFFLFYHNFILIIKIILKITLKITKSDVYYNKKDYLDKNVYNKYVNKLHAFF